MKTSYYLDDGLCSHSSYFSSLHTAYNNIDQRFTWINKVDLIEESSKLKPSKTMQHNRM